MNPRGSGKLRIIGGEWRSRIVDFDADNGVRPTPDRVRQTVFDWVAPRIEGATCLDLFAGSGALGLEALSRGAGSVTFIESGREQARQIREALFKLKSSDGEVVTGDALTHLRQSLNRYDMVFLDPPYASHLLQEALQLLPRVLKAEARIYVEWPSKQPLTLPAGYHLLREKEAGQVGYGLLTHAGVIGVQA